MLQWALGALSRVFTAPSAQCTPEQRKTWNGFVDSFTASAINGGSPQSLVLERDGDDRGNGAGLDKGPVTFRPAAKRVVAIGDLHGDYEKCERAFRMAGLIDENRNWVGGETVAVQVGDVLDRGGDEIRIFHFLEELKRQAASHGGALHVLNGNHEILNVAGRFRYATESAFAEFERYEKIQRFGRFLKCKCGVDRRKCEMAIPSLSSSGVEARREALKPGGSISAAFLARNPVALVVGSTVFVHGGLHPRHLKYGVERMNRETSEWIRGDSKDPGTVPWFLSGRNAIVWSRMYSMPEEDKCDCAMLEQALLMLPRTTRMVVGHTVQYGGINAACDGSVFRVDVGQSSGVSGAEPEVLEIIEDREVRRIRANASVQVLVSASQALRQYRARMERRKLRA